VITEDRDDAEYWNALADRVASAAVRHAKSNSLEWLAQSRAGWATTLLLVSAALVFMMLPSGRPVGDPGPASLDVVLPTDEVGKAMARRDQPPSIGALLVEPRGERLR
jgi:hypothetical protein